MSRGTRGGNSASALQVIRFFPQRACLAEWQHVDVGQQREPGEDHLQTRPNRTEISKAIEVREQ